MMTLPLPAEAPSGRRRSCVPAEGSSFYVHDDIPCRGCVHVETHRREGAALERSRDAGCERRPSIGGHEADILLCQDELTAAIEVDEPIERAGYRRLDPYAPTQ